MTPYASVWGLPDSRLAHRVAEAICLASDWYGGQACPLYAVSCGRIAHWTVDLVQYAACVFDRCASEGSGEDYDALRDAADAMRDLAAVIGTED